MGQHKYIFLLLGEPELASGQPRRFQLSLGERKFAAQHAGRLLLARDPVERHLGPHVVIQRSVRVVSDDFLTRALALTHRFQRSVPVQQLENCHQLLELEHRAPLVRLEHESAKVNGFIASAMEIGRSVCLPEGTDAGVGSVVVVLRLERGSGFLDGLRDELVADAPRWVLVENGVHQRDLGRTSSGFGLRRAALRARNSIALSTSEWVH